MDDYVEFGNFASICLTSVANEYNVKLSEIDKINILKTFRQLQPYDDVRESLNMLKENDIKVIAVYNSSLDMMKTKLTNVNIIDLFDSYYSVDSVKKYKSFVPIYKYVAQIENLYIENIFMVATHAWDLYGAKKVGLNTAYVKRKNTIYNPNYLQSDIYEDNLVDTVEGIIKLNKSK